MAGPSLTLRVLGDMVGLSNSFTAMGEKGKTAASGVHSAFSSMLGTLNSTGVLGPFGNALSTADQSLQQMSGHAKDTSGKMIGLGGAAAGVGLALTALGSKDQAAHQQLQASIAATGHSYDQYGAKVEEAIHHEEHFGHTADETQNALRVLTSATNSPTQALKLLNTATDLAAAKHEDLTAAASTLGKAYNGSGKVMKEFGITVSSTGTAQKELAKATSANTKADDAYNTSKRSLVELEAADASAKTVTTVMAMKLQDAQNKVADASLVATGAHQSLAKAQHDVATGTSANSAALSELGKKLSGQASAQADTFTGHLKGIKAEVTDHISLFAQKYGPAISTAGLALAGLGSAVKATTAVTEALKLGQVAQAAASGIATAATWLWNIALEANPIVLIATLIGVVLVGAIVLIVTHFNTFKAVVLDVWNAVLVAFDAIKNVIMGVYNWIAANWPLLLAILTGPFGLAVYMIVTYWHTILDFFKGLPGDITAAIGDVTNLLYDIGKTIIDSLKRGLDDAWKGVENFFKTAANKVTNFLKNPLSIFSPSKVMMEQGASIMQGLGLGLAAGFNQHVQPALNATVAALTPGRGGGTAASALSPAMASSASGPAVVVHNAHFSSGVDVDTFMRRAAWVAKTRKP
jgi:hypothetical protein